MAYAREGLWRASVALSSIPWGLMSDADNLLMYGAIALVAWLLYQSYVTAATTATTTTPVVFGCQPPNMNVGGECLPPVINSMGAYNGR